MKILLLFMAVASVFKFVARAISSVFRYFKKEKVSPEPIRRDWYGNCENCGMLGGLHRFQGKRYCAMCYARIKTEWDFSKKELEDTGITTIPKGNKMNILKDFDTAISNAEDTPKGYYVGERCYDTYTGNDAWKDYLDGMSAEHRSQYGDGSGGELKEKNGRPPKMAAFASSSRMTYLLSKDIPGFVFEKQLSTVIGGVANLDGYWEGNGQYIFVEAKCREPYSHKSPETIKQNYKPLYTYLQSKLPNMFSCTMEDIPGTRDMRVEFFCCGKEVSHFDMKQMLCHLLGVANRMLLDNNCNAPIQFLYLLYNPTELALSKNSQKEILSIYHATCEAAQSYDFKQIFACVVDFLMEEKEYTISKEDAENLKNNFQFALCDQKKYQNYFDVLK